MRKIVLFVEGQSELIFIREFLLKWFSYQIDIECRNLLTDERFDKADYDFTNSSASLHAQIINVGMDGSVLRRILKREKHFYNLGYESIIGVRDMYSEDYRKKSKDYIVDSSLNERFRQGTYLSILKNAEQPERIKFCFAIMELETWLIGIPSLWDSFDASFKNENNKYFINPESIFHPAVFVGQLFQSQNSNYSKKRGEIESIVGKISREDYIELNESQRCLSFCELVNYVQN